MTDVTKLSASERADAILRELAVRAIGASGADIERTIREARQQARREKRPLSYVDIHAAIGGPKRDVPELHLWRMAVHEAGHVIAQVRLHLGKVKHATINGKYGASYVESEIALHELQTEAQLTNMLVILLAGRAAEHEIIGSVIAGSGGSTISDLARATDFALDMETKHGFGGHWPLLYRDERNAHRFHHDPGVMQRTHNRLENAYDRARKLIIKHNACVLKVAQGLLEYETLEQEQLLALVSDPAENMLSRV